MLHLGPPILVSRYTEYWDTTTNLSSINTGTEVTQYRHVRYWYLEIGPALEALVTSITGKLLQMTFSGTLYLSCVNGNI